MTLYMPKKKNGCKWISNSKRFDYNPILTATIN